MATYYSDMYKRRTCVYRLYSELGDLLYVGISVNPQARLAQHRRRDWGRGVADVTVKWYDDRESAKAAERAAIRDENPLHNIVRPGAISWRVIA